MGVDYLARKKAKKNRKQDASGTPRRVRKKNQARRLCRGPCYQEPRLTPEDLADEGNGEARLPSTSGELAAYASMSFGGRASDKPVAQADKQATKQQPRKRKPESSRPAAMGVPVAEVAPPKQRMSTDVRLLDVHTAKLAPPRQAVPVAAVSAELQQFPGVVQRCMASFGFTEPTPIQSSCWPSLLAGKDLQALAEPGSGKTLGYLMPAVALVVQAGHDPSTRPDGPLALILVPTHELAQQVWRVCRDLRTHSGLRACCIHGGVDKEEQVAALSKKPHLLVATPGRLLDLVEDGSLALGAVRVAVLDEADKMLGLGFKPQIDRLKELLLPPRTASRGAAKKQRRVQVALFTATLPAELDGVAASWLHQPQVVRLGGAEASISRSVTQVVQVCAEHKKPAKLQKHLERVQEASKGLRNPPRILIFVNRIKTCRFVHGLVKEAGLRAVLLHGERSQEEREAAMAAFRSGKAQVLVATDVAGRGLHISNLPYLVSYDMPPSLEAYVHRVGRTGRLAADGHAYTFFTREMARLAPPLVQLLQQHGQALDPNLAKLADAWRTAADKLASLAGALGEEPAVPDRDDVLRQLGMPTAQQKKKQKRDQAARQEGRDGDASAPQAALADGQEGALAAGPAEAQPAFIPSRCWAGTRPGYAFKKGRHGQGYYLDAVQQQQQQERQQRQQQRGERSKGKRAGTTQQQEKEYRQQLRQKYTHAPIGGAPAAAAQDKPQQVLAGRLKELKRQRQLAAAAGQLEGFSSEEEEEEAAAKAPPSKRLKALPGRLRKKLAKHRSTGGS